MLLLDNREVREGWQALKDHVQGLFTKHGCDVKSARRWEERRLAYPIKHHQRATYLLMYMEADSEQLATLRRDLQFDEKVIRDLVLRCEAIPEDAYEPEEAFDESAVPIEDIVAAPEEAAEEDSTDDDDAKKDDDDGDAEASADDGDSSDEGNDDSGEEEDK